MPSTTSLLARLSADYPQFSFVSSDEYLWSPAEHTIYYNQTEDEPGLLLHEVSHGLLDHTDYARDIDLIKMERAAWEQATVIAPTYDVAISSDLVESTLDTYRDWLHARSTCPHCQATGLQTQKHIYSCPACTGTWKVNEARVCGLKRTKI